jgi:L-fuculose-phosphate aldolase
MQGNIDELFARETMVEACRTLNASGINQGAAGNISLRFGAKMLITPSGVDYETLDPDMVFAMNLTDAAPARDERTGLIASSEWRFHRDILTARHDVGAVVHTHARYATVLSMLRRLPVLLPEEETLALCARFASYGPGSKGNR